MQDKIHPNENPNEREISTIWCGDPKSKVTLGKISAFGRAASFDPPDANREEIAIKNLYFLTRWCSTIGATSAPCQIGDFKFFFNKNSKIIFS